MFLANECGRCYATRADVIAHFWFFLFYGWCYCHWLWQMLLPLIIIILNMADVIAMCICGWCYYHWADVIAHYIIVYLADVIAILVADVITTVKMCWLMVLPSGRWYSHWRVEDGVADVITTGLMLLPWVNLYFNLSSGMSYRTSSQICGRWYLPTFLFRDGLLTLI